ncbi:transcriptional regulator [Burkholderia sp. Ch1-1]|uniref:Transcriptional regulator n=1 Tax=Paraburkholderia dioscoreae TaxID=2604047 RepID=A0A5Q4YUQ5_9BURK|nr:MULTISPECIES: GntR family transcriptional regulator [Paraburkholderia]EIF32606.1 transcriptional regulator [Burkholderia sp. Ch1-1]MDR8397149.1 GntR family transcriptional regulator [Paraburkholderia sp. USG1]VVD27460.1 Transcriptional regulator [Paraburkholderia dioscoreae]
MTSKLLKIQPRPDYVEEVYEVLLGAICDGSLAPGTRLTQEDIAEQLSVSRSPVLQALRLLKKDGLVQDAPGRGLLVAPLEASALADLYEIRGALDRLAAGLAAGAGARLDPKLIERGRKAAQTGNVHAMIDADMEFHFAVYAASGNRLIAQTAHGHWVHIRRVMGAVLQAPGQRPSIWDEHAAIANAIEAGDCALAERLSGGHAKHASQLVAGQFDALLGVLNLSAEANESVA